MALWNLNIFVVGPSTSTTHINLLGSNTSCRSVEI
jgi:hypothetical protein